MKQSITKEQWDELDNDQKSKVLNFGRIQVDLLEPNIGQMIEFLGDDLDDIENTNDWGKDYKIKEYYKDFNWLVQLKGEWREIEEGEVKTRCESACCGEFFIANELADALFEAVKEKLK